jgi:tetratricopeptide (TPR) repeat protein
MNLLQSRASAKTGRRVVIDLQKAERALKDGNLKQVEQICTEVLEERPDSVHACQVMAELFLKQGKFDEGMSWIDRARQHEPANPRSLYLLGRVLEHRGDLAGAEDAYRSSVLANPEYPDALAFLGDLLLRTGRKVEAEGLFRRAILFDREHGLANLSLGAILFHQGRPDLSVPHLQAGIQRELTHRPGQFMLGVALQQLGRLDEAITTFRRLVASGDEDPEVFARLGESLEDCGEIDLAGSGYESALEIRPGYARAAARLAGMMAVAGNAPAALELLAPLLEPGDAPACLVISKARALRACGRHDEALLRLANLVKRPAAPADIAPAHQLLGELLDLRGEYDRAFAQFRHARRLRGGSYRAAEHEDFVSRLIECFNREALDQMPRGSASDVPVFIIGMPRSGSSLVEQILASHPRAAGTGALPHIDISAGRIGRYNAAGLPYPECLPALRERDLRELSASYLARAFADGAGARRIVDSMWINYLHVGLIELMFPYSRLVHLRRSPLDAGLSAWSRAREASEEPFSGELAELAHSYVQYRRLMDHWRAITTLPIHDMDFEALLADPEGEVRRLLEFLGLRWEPSCLEFYSQPRVARSASHEMLRLPLQADAVGWSRHYAKHNGPLRDALAAAGYPPD